MSAKTPKKTPAPKKLPAKRNPDTEAAASSLHAYNAQEYRLEDLEAFMGEEEEEEDTAEEH